MKCMVCRKEIDDGLLCGICAVYSSVPDALLLYDLLKDRVRYNGHICRDHECKFISDDLYTCLLFNKKLGYKDGIVRCQQCIDIFGE